MSVLTEQASSQMERVDRSSSLFALTELVYAMLARQRSRKALARLAPYHLDDIGISQEQALAEAAKPGWMR